MVDKNDVDSEWWIVEEIQKHLRRFGYSDIPIYHSLEEVMIDDEIHIKHGIVFVDDRIISLCINHDMLQRDLDPILEDYNRQGILEKLPEFFADLKSLQYLDLSKLLMQLDLRNNHEIFEKFCQNNTALRLLNLRGCDIKTLPKSFGNLKTLEKLDLSDNYIWELPESFGDLQSLKYLDLSETRFFESPFPLRKLKNLEVLYLDFRSVELGDLLSDLELIGKLRSLKTLSLNSSLVPESIGNLESLQRLYLVGNQLKKLPKTIGNLSSLEELDLCNNQLTSVPEFIGNLRSLISLRIGDNLLTFLPKFISNLKSLKTLYLRKNRFSTLPEWVLTLPNLEYLDMRNNPLDKKMEKNYQRSLEEIEYFLWNEYGKVVFLEPRDDPESEWWIVEQIQKYMRSYNYLELPVYDSMDKIIIDDGIFDFYIAHGIVYMDGKVISLGIYMEYLQPLPNRRKYEQEILEELPEVFADLKSLKYLDLSTFWIYLHKPDNFAIFEAFCRNNSALRLLSLKGCDIKVLPESTGDLESLQRLNLRENSLKALPKSFGNLKSLEELDLGDNRLTALPDSIGNLRALKELYISRNQLTALPDSIGDLRALKELYISQNQLTALPDSIGNLRALKELYISYNQLTALPDSIGNLRALQELYISENHLTSLPNSFCNLESLINCDLGGNQLRGYQIQDCILDLPHLKYFRMGYRSLKDIKRALQKQALQKDLEPKN